MTFQCQRCGRAGRYSTWVTSRWHLENRLQRCDWCGTAHSCRQGRAAEPISPPLVSLLSGVGVLSPWFDARYRPAVPGAFECCFQDGVRVVLWWSGRAWEWAGYRVDVRTLQKWRGRWASSND